MNQKSGLNGTTLILRSFGGFLMAFGLIFGTAWLFNRLDAQAFADGYRVEGTVMHILDGEAPIVVIEFVDQNGRSQQWNLEKMTQTQRDTLSEGDQVVAVQMRNSPSRVMLLEQVENRSSDRNGLIISALFFLPGLYLVSQKRPFGNEAQQQRMATRQGRLAGGSMFLFMGLVMLIGFVAMLLESDMHLVARVVFGGFCLLTGGGMTILGGQQLWQAWRS